MSKWTDSLDTCVNVWNAEYLCEWERIGEWGGTW